MTKNPAEIAGTRYKNEKLMRRMQKTDGTSRCFAQSENIKRQSLINLTDKKMAYVIQRIKDTGRTDVLQVPALKRNYEMGDFDGFYEAINSYEKKEDDKKVLGIIKSHLSLDLYQISALSGLSREQVKEALSRLITNEEIDCKYKSLKEKMDPFEKGDFVKFIDSVYTMYTEKVYYSDNVFKIIELNKDNTIKLIDIDVSVPVEDIEAIPIDGLHDRSLYYDPPGMASIVTGNHPVPEHHSHIGKYYLDGLDDSYFDGGTLKELVCKKNCQFVHEVQHCLREEVNTDDIKLDITIRHYKMLMNE